MKSIKKKYNLHFYDLLFKSNPMFDHDMYHCQRKKRNTIKYVFKKSIRLLNAIYSISRLLFLPRHKILFFNHTCRTHKCDHRLRRSLYINEEVFDKNDFHFIENNENKIAFYSGPASILNSSIINELISILSIPEKLINKFREKPTSSKESLFLYKTICWSVILRVLRPKKILFVVWYAYQPVIVAAKKLGIPTIDLQHGSIDYAHEFYYIKNTSGSLDDYTLPDECWVYGNYWKQQLINSGWGEKNVKVFGYYLNMKSNYIENNDFSYILYTTSINTQIEKVRAHIDSIRDELIRRSMKIIISPHPMQNSKDFVDITSDIVMLSDKDSYELLKNCQSHVGFSSSLLWEGLHFNKPTYILNFNEYKIYFPFLEELVKNNLARNLESGEFPENYIFNVDIIPEYISSSINKALIYS